MLLACGGHADPVSSSRICVTTLQIKTKRTGAVYFKLCFYFLPVGNVSHSNFSAGRIVAEDAVLAKMNQKNIQHQEFAGRLRPNY